MATNTHARSARALLAAACTLALLSACEPSMEEVVAEQRPAVEQVFGKLRALAGPAASAAPVETDGVTLGGAKVVLDGEGTNAIFIRSQDLAAPETAASDGPGGTHAGTVETCGDALTGEFYGVAGGAQLFLEECAAAQYAFVLRTHVDHAPQVSGTDSFEPGLYEGDVLLFRLADATLLGGFRVSGKSSDEVQVLLDDAGNPIDPSERLQSDLDSMVFVDIQDKLRTHVPGSIPP